MKKLAIILGLVVLCSMTSCKKEKQCRCAVRHGQTIRLITIDKGDCSDIRFLFYDKDIIHPDITDSVVCTDFKFASQQ